MTSERTKSLKKKRNIFGALSYITWICTGLFLVTYTIIIVSQKPGSTFFDFLSEEAKKALLSIGITAIIGIVAAIFIKEKIRTFVWMACLVMASVMFKEPGMFTVLGLWLIDEYIFATLYKKYKNLVTINKEIDLR